MATTPTKDDIPSEKPVNLKFNAGKLDEEVNSDALTYKDRFDVERLTNAGRNAAFTSDQQERSDRFETQISSQKSRFDTQIESQDSQFKGQISSQQEEFITQITGQRGEFNDLLASSGYSWLDDYVDGPVTFTNRSQVTVYNGVAYRLAASTPVGFTTTGNSAASWDVDKSKLVAIGDNDIRQQVQYQFGQWLPDAIAIFNLTTDYEYIRVRGFYAANDGGEGVWRQTGAVNQLLAGTHVITEAKIYNANGVEYVLQPDYSKPVSVVCNGAKDYTMAQAADKTTDNFICLGQVINGLNTLMGPDIYPEDSGAKYLGYPRFDIEVPSKIYRIGKEDAVLQGKVDYFLNKAKIYVFAGASYQYKDTGKRLSGFVHGYDQIKAKWEAVGKITSWSSVSLQHVHIRGGHIIGDHSYTAYDEDCTSGIGILALNPEYVTLEDVEIHGFVWCAVGKKAEVQETVFKRLLGNAFDDNEKDYRYVMDFWSAAGVGRFGNFYGFNCINCRFYDGRRGVYRNDSDWSYVTGGIINNKQRWLDAGNVSGSVPDYIGVATGTGFECSAAYTSPAATVLFNVGKSVWYTTATKHTFEALYTEWAHCIFTISAYGFVGGYSRVLGLSINNVSMYKDNLNDYKNIQFETGCFGEIQDDGTYVYPSGFSHFDTFSGLPGLSIDSPTRDWGAFRHGGFDGKYGLYNISANAGADFDILRDRPYAKKMFNPFGAQLNAGVYFQPWQQPSAKSNIHIWIDDLTGNYRPGNIQAWVTAAGQENASASDTALYKSFAEEVIDFGNGCKLLVINNKRLSAYDGIVTYSPNAGIQITIPADTPIVIKAIEAYTGGISMFPNGLGDYIPQSPATQLVNTNTAQRVGLDSSLGGGLFMPGDMIAPWVYIRRNKSGDYRITPTVTTGATLQHRVVTSGVTLEAAYKVAFTATIAAVDSTKGLTTLTIPTAMLPYVVMGVPLYVTGGSSNGTVGQVHLLKRLVNSSGATSQYIAIGVVGSVGDSLAIDQSQLSAYAFNGGDYNVTSVTASGNLDTTGGRVRLGVNGASGAKSIDFMVNGGTTVTSSIAAAYAGTTSYHHYQANRHVMYGNVYASADNESSLGTADARWTQVYAANSAISTSNKEKKTGFRQMTEAELSAFYEIGQLDSIWQWLERYQTEGDDARLHSGPTVQDAIEVMESHGLDWTKYACFCYDHIPAREEIREEVPAVYEIIPAEFDDDGNEITPEVKVLISEASTFVVQEARDESEEYSFRKEELIMSIQRSIISKQQDIDRRLSEIESK